MQAAARLFALNGFDATSVQDIVEAAALTKGAYYYYFDSKDQLLYEMHRRVLSHQLNRSGQILANEPDPTKALYELIIELVESIVQNHDEVTIVLRENRRFPPGAAPRVEADRRRLHELFRSVVAEAQASGGIRADLSPELVTLAILGMCTWTYDWYTTSSLRDPREIGAGMAEIALNGLRPATSDALPASKGSEPLRPADMPRADGGEG